MNNKPQLTPPEQKLPETLQPFSPDPRISRMKFVALLVFLVLLITVIAVVAVLPDQLSKKRERLAKTGEHGATTKDVLVATEARQLTETIPKEQPEGERSAEAELLLEEVLRRQAALEADGVKVWGLRTLLTSYPDVLAKLSEADAYFKAQRYSLSANAYKETIGLLEQLDSSRPERIRTGLQAGMDALDRFDDEISILEFETVLALDPANAESNQGLERARQLPRIKDLVERGQMAERQDALEQARKSYAEAVALDGKLIPVLEHLQRVEELIRLRQFNHAVLEAESGLERGDFAATQTALQRARQLQPDASEVSDIARRLHSRKRQAELRRIRNLAIAL